MHISVISYAAPVNVLPIAQAYHDRTVKLLRTTEHTVTNIENVVLTEEENNAAMETIATSFPDMIVLEFGSFASGDMVMDLITRFKNIPLFIRAYNDPLVPTHPTVPLNSMTGFLMATSFLKRLKKQYRWSYADADSVQADKQLLRSIQAIMLKKQLHNRKYAVVGSRAPGFYLCMVDELRFRNEIGPKIEYLSLSTLIAAADKLSEQRVQSKIQEIYSNVNVTVSQNQIEKTVRLFLALRDYVEVNRIDALTLKCWPELQSLYGCAGCAVLSMLNNEGITACCEGDVTGLCTMDMLSLLTGKAVFFADLVGKSQTGALKAWHCGFGPHGLCKEGCPITYTEQATMRGGIGTGVQYEMKHGRATVCKLSEQEDGYKLFAAEGSIGSADREILGVQADMELDNGFENTLRTLVENGFEQHYALVHEELREVLSEYCYWANIKIFS